MDSTIVSDRIGALGADLRARGVAAAYLFGSTARGDARADSDIDLFVDPAADRRFSLLDLIGVRHLLEDRLAVKVDVTTRAGLHPAMRATIEREAIRVL